MTIDKHAYLRYQVLDRCFSNVNRKYFKEDLINEVVKELHDIDPDINSYSIRQFIHDINFIKSVDGWSVPLLAEREKRKAFYYYSDHNFSILNQPPNKMELEQVDISKLVFARLSSQNELFKRLYLFIIFKFLVHVLRSN